MRQLGFDEHEVARRLAKNTGKQENYGYGDLMDGQLLPVVYQRRSNTFEIGDFILEMYNKIWERRLFNEVTSFYTENAVVQYVCDKLAVGHQQIQGMLVSLFASVPCARFLVERVTCNQGQGKNQWDVAVRWRIKGLHEGIGFFGQPSHKVIEILGISHLAVRNGKITEELTLFDGLDVLRQTYLGAEDTSEL